MATGHTTRDEHELERELAAMLDIESFDPPAEFVRNANLSDPSIYETAEEDWQGWWVSQAERLHWFKKWDQVLDDSNPPFYKWFVGGKLNVSYNCLDRHVEAGLGDRVAYHWHGEEGDEQDITYADLLARVQKFSNALKDLGIKKGDVVGIYMGMIPEVVVAMLSCARIGAVHNVVFGGFSAESVRERMEFSEAKALITVDGAARKGKVAAVKQSVDEVMGELEHLKHIIVVKSKGTDCEMKDGRDVWYHEIVETAAMCARPRRWTPRTRSHPLHVRVDRRSRRGSCTPRAATWPARRSAHQNVFDIHADHRHVVVLRGCRLGHRPHLHRLRAAGQRHDRGSCMRARRTTRTAGSGGSLSSATRRRSSTPPRPRSGRASSGAPSTRTSST